MSSSGKRGHTGSRLLDSREDFSLGQECARNRSGRDSENKSDWLSVNVEMSSWGVTVASVRL